MAEFIRYFSFFYRLTGKRILIVLLITFLCIIFQALSGAAFLPVLEMGSGSMGANIVTKSVFNALVFLKMESPDQQLPALLIFATICFAVANVSTIISEAYMARIQSGVIRELQTGITERLFNAEYAYFISHNTGFLNTVIINYTVSVTYSFKFYSKVMINALFAIAYAAFATVVDIKLALVMFAAALPLLSVIKLISRKNREYSAQNAAAHGVLNNIVIQILTCFKYFKATNTFHNMAKHLSECSGKVGGTIEKLTIWGIVGQSLLTPIAVAIISAIVYYKFSVEHESISDVVAVLVCLYAAYQRMIILPASYQKFLGSTGPISEFYRIEKELLENKEKFGGTRTPDFDGELAFENVSFSYSKEKEPVLRELSFKILANSSVAFVGESGAGKSTLVNLITGLFSPTKGTLSVGGMPYSEINMGELRKRISYVTQEPVIFNDTVKNNLTLWDDMITMEKIRESVSRAHADNFISAMIGNYDTMLGSSGVNISGGQRQRIAIARELLRDTRLLILDEATSALDTETEMSIQENLNKIKGAKTIIIIAHRLSTIKDCDMIFVLDRGNIVEQGSFSELIAKNGKFKKMVDRQSLN